MMPRYVMAYAVGMALRHNSEQRQADTPLSYVIGYAMPSASRNGAI